MHRQDFPIMRESQAKPPKKARARKKTSAPSGVTVARLIGASEHGSILIQLPTATAPATARTTVELSSSDIGSEVVVAFEAGDERRPIILGRIQSGAKPPTQKMKLSADGQSLLLEADQEIVLRCGRSSITLTRAGKVLIRGAYLLSRSSGVNRIKGGSVQIN
ncbi:MAG TPA: DUF6484 domain-containing protein [Tepidisphaeraceae bacterium]|nr:DUF6484 domain-containing protein [Tepidisphaeraceae bacterium]